MGHEEILAAHRSHASFRTQSWRLFCAHRFLCLRKSELPDNPVPDAVRRWIHLYGAHVASPHDGAPMAKRFVTLLILFASLRPLFSVGPAGHAIVGTPPLFLAIEKEPLSEYKSRRDR